MTFSFDAIKDAEWQYFNRLDFHPSLRRRKLVGRRRLDELEAEREVLQRLKITYIDFVARTSVALKWLCETTDTSGLWWQSWETQSNCIYLIPTADHALRFHRSDRHFDVMLSPDGAGLCATEFAVHWLLRERNPSADLFCYDDLVSTFAHHLEAYRERHPEYGKIVRVID